jgi:hypothetical protein
LIEGKVMQVAQALASGDALPRQSSQLELQSQRAGVSILFSLNTTLTSA